jgi:cytochrome c
MGRAGGSDLGAPLSMGFRDINRLGTALLCVAIAVGASVLAALLLVPDTAPPHPAFAIAGLDDEAGPTEAATQAIPIADRLARASAAHGAELAAAQCGACHTLDRDGIAMVGPNLWGVAGASVAAKQGYHYSDALRALGGRWTPARLDQWLTRPQAMAPGTRMGFAGLDDPGQRADLVAFLIGLAPAAAPPAAGAAPVAFETLVDGADPKQGAAAAAAQCGACHGFDKGGAAMVGPNLYGVVGRGVAQAPDYAYSASLSAHRGVWTVTALGDWLANPRQFAPGTKMGFAGIADPGQRAPIVAYLRTLAP